MVPRIIRRQLAASPDVSVTTTRNRPFTILAGLIAHPPTKIPLSHFIACLPAATKVPERTLFGLARSSTRKLFWSLSL
jgi:hypothetical protein